MYFTSDLVVASVRKPGPDDVMERYIAARMKPFSMTVMGGGHQLDMDLRSDVLHQRSCRRVGTEARPRRRHGAVHRGADEALLDDGDGGGPPARHGPQI